MFDCAKRTSNIIRPSSFEAFFNRHYVMIDRFPNLTSLNLRSLGKLRYSSVLAFFASTT